MNLLFTLCGRAGSKGFKNKNLKTFLGLPLIYYALAVIELYKQDCDADLIDVVVNTDSKELWGIVSRQKKISCEYIDRNADLGGDSVPKVAVIRDSLIRMEKQREMTYDIVVDLDITSPLRTVADVRNAVAQKLKRTDTDVVYSVAPARRNPYFNMVQKKGDYFCKAVSSEFTARQQAPVMYDMNASIYAYSVEALKNKDEKVFFNDRCDAILMRDTGILDIDSEEDFELMQVIAAYLFEHEKEFKEVRDCAAGLI